MHIVTGCSHLRAITFFAESVAVNPNKTAFLAVQCSGTQSIQTGHVCSEFNTTSINYMGFYATKIPAGNFFLEVNSDFPYSAIVSEL